jgi:putative oxidoreductase
VRRLFWTYPDGFPGLGLLVMRFATGSAVLVRCVTAFRAEPAGELATLITLLSSIPALFLIAGRRTAVAATLVAGLELWRFVSEPGDPWVHVLLGTLGVALVMLGPGAWSADAYLFGWRPIHVGARHGSNAP